MVISHNFYLSLALAEAWKYQLLTFPNPAVGATLISPCGKILAVEAHHKAGKPHAEVNALQQAYYQLTKDEAILDLDDSQEIHTYLLQHHNGCFRGCEIYTTLEPCSHHGKTPSCASLIKALELKKCYIGAKDPNEVAKGGSCILREAGIAVEEGILEKESQLLLLPFLRHLQGSFVFFKWAQRLDGTTDNGVISSKASRELVHKMRDVCDLLVIGGNTVRQDRPTLDARLCGGKAPDVLIYSHTKEFDPTIALFQVKGRKVHVSNSLELIKQYKCVMIEGGGAMFEATKEFVDLYLAFFAPSMKKGNNFGVDAAKFRFLNQQKVGDDIMAWMILER
jgi:diaminohydroxyphosphoribosylaminopyrimidine deaminase/5-amino-6-(5-phosphoribosylamino)uracil reductase